MPSRHRSAHPPESFLLQREPQHPHRSEAASGSLTITLDDSTTLTHRVMHAAGHPERPMDDATLVAKFVDCAAHAARPIEAGCARAQAERILAPSADVPAHQIIDSSACMADF